MNGRGGGLTLDSISFFFNFVCYWSLIEIEITALTRSRSPTFEYIKYHRALVYNFGRKSKASFGSSYHKDLNTKGRFKKKQKTGKTDQLRTQRTFE